MSEPENNRPRKSARTTPHAHLTVVNRRFHQLPSGHSLSEYRHGYLPKELPIHLKLKHAGGGNEKEQPGEGDRLPRDGNT